MSNKKIVVIYYGDDWNKKIPISSRDTRRSFEDWHVRGQSIGIDFYRAAIEWFDVDNKVFNKCWAFRDGKWRKIENKIKPDLIFDKVAGKYDYDLFNLKTKIIEKIPIFNDPNFRSLFDSKLNQAVIFKEFMVDSFLVNNLEEYKKNIDKIKSDMVVIKPIYGSGGFGIIIDKKEQIRGEQLIFPCIIQEFIKNTIGIPGFSKKGELADLRMVYLNHKLVYSLSRIAKEGSLFTNFHQGAVAKLVPDDKIPQKAKILAKEIINKISFFPNAHYSLDFIFKDSREPILVEMNTTPGFDLVYILGDRRIQDKNFNVFIETIRMMINEN